MVFPDRFALVVGVKEPTGKKLIPVEITYA
jgi:hypothetical protein